MRSGTAVKALLASVSPAALALAGPADAQNLSPRAPALAAPSWTGCYVGAHAGFGWGVQMPTTRRDNFFFSSATNNTTTSSSTRRVDSSGGVYGGQVGCNYQFAHNMVFGAEASFSGANLRGSASDDVTGGAINVSTDRMASVVGRLGVTSPNNQTLWYLKGGSAYARNHWSLTAQPISFIEDRYGTIFGGGVEWVFRQNVTLFIDFSRSDFGRSGNSGTFTTGNYGCGINGTCFDTYTLTSGSQRIDTIKFGANYRLNSP